MRASQPARKSANATNAAEYADRFSGLFSQMHSDIAYRHIIAHGMLIIGACAYILHRSSKTVAIIIGARGFNNGVLTQILNSPGFGALPS